MRPEIEQEEKKNQRTAFISTGIVAVIAACLLFLIGCWKAPGPPWPNVGVMVDFGQDEVAGQFSEVENEAETEAEEDTEEVNEVESTTPEETEETETEELVEATDETDYEETTGETEINNATSTASETNESENVTEETKNSSNSSTVSNDNADTWNSNQGNTEEEVSADVFDGEGPIGGGNEGDNNLGSLGWKWERQPQMPDVPHPGLVKAEIKVNDLGRVVSVKLLENPYPQLEQSIIASIKNQKLLRLSGFGRANAMTTARVSFQFQGK